MFGSRRTRASPSIVVALAIGTIEVLQVMSTNPGLRAAAGTPLNSLDFGTLGYAMVVLLIIAWAVSVSAWKVRRIEDRWNAMLSNEPTR
jgi:high-affinity nickel-transport protein